MDLAKEGVDLAVARLRDADRAALVVYDDEVDTVQPLAPATPRLKASLRLALHGVDPGVDVPLRWVDRRLPSARRGEARRHADATATRIRRVILLTDGLANVGILDPGMLARHAGELRRRGIATTTVGVGQDFDEGCSAPWLKRAVAALQYVADPEVARILCPRAAGVVQCRGDRPGGHARPRARRRRRARLRVPGRCANALEVAIGDLPAGDEIDLVFTVRSGRGNGDSAASRSHRLLDGSASGRAWRGQCRP